MVTVMMGPNFQPRGMHPPTSNTERQREFRRRNPDYYKQYRARRKAEAAAMTAQRLAAAQAVPLAIPAPTIPEGVWITLPALVPVPVEAAKPEAAHAMVMRVAEG